MDELKGKVAIVSGASTPAGIGRAIAKRFATAGASLLLVAEGTEDALLTELTLLCIDHRLHRAGMIGTIGVGEQRHTRHAEGGGERECTDGLPRHRTKPARGGRLANGHLCGGFCDLCIGKVGLKGFLGGEVLFHGAHADRRS